jgi:HSP20 family protein
MHLRYRYVSYCSNDGAQRLLEQHYRQLLNDALQQSQRLVLHTTTKWRPPADILESEEMIRVQVELAGMREEDIEITLYDDALVVSGERRADREHQEGFSYREAQIRYGRFRVEVFILTPISRDDIHARYKDGILSVDLPKVLAEDEKPVYMQSVSSAVKKE